MPLEEQYPLIRSKHLPKILTILRGFKTTIQKKVL